MSRVGSAAPLLFNPGYQPFFLQRPGRLKDAMDLRNDSRNDMRNDPRNDLRNDLRNDPRGDLRSDMRSRLEESTILPAAKRQAQQEESQDQRLPPPSTTTTPPTATPTTPVTPGQPGANIKITSRGTVYDEQHLYSIACRLNCLL